MTDRTAEIVDLERRARDAERMAEKSPFKLDRDRFAGIAAEYRKRATKLKA